MRSLFTNENMRSHLILFYSKNRPIEQAKSGNKGEFNSSSLVNVATTTGYVVKVLIG